MKQTDYISEQQQEVERRVEYLEQNVDMNANHFGRRDWIAVGITVVVSLALLIWGFFA